MTVDRMTIERLNEILNAYGADPLRWPVGERLTAQALAAREPRAAVLIAEAAAMDMLLDQAPAEAPSPALIAAVLKRRPKQAWIVRAWRDLFPEMPVWRPALGLAVALALGFGLQTAAADRMGFDEASDEVAISDESPADIAPLSGETIAEEDVL